MPRGTLPVRLTMLLASGLVACAPDAWVDISEEASGVSAQQDQAELRQLILSSSAGQVPAEVPPSATGEEQRIENGQGVSQECVLKRFTGTALYETLASFDPNADSVWPGAIVQGETLSSGLVAPIGLPRRPGSIVISEASLGGGASGSAFSRDLEAPSLASSREAIAEIMRSGATFPAKTSYVAETAYSATEAAVKLGLSLGWLTGGLKSSFEKSWMARRTTMVVRFVQAYYTVSFEAPAAPEKVFGEDVSADDARPYMRPGNAPGYVSSVTYGRTLIMKIESDHSESELRGALDATFGGFGGGVSGASAEVLGSSSVSVFVFGGSSEDAARLQTADATTRAAALATYIQRGAAYDPASPGVPISYSVRRLADNQAVRVASTLDYQIPICTPAAVDVNLQLQRLHIRRDGKAGGSTSGDYAVWIETSPSQEGGALPSTTDAPQREEIVAASTSMDDGKKIELNFTRFVKLPKQEGAKLTVGARVKSNAKGKRCEMRREHGFRFDPSKNAGEWANTGDNVISCTDGDSALIGNNSLVVNLEYAFTPVP